MQTAKILEAVNAVAGANAIPDDKTLTKTYYDLCDLRDKVNAEVAPVQVELDKANAEVEAAQLKAAELAAKIDAIRGGAEWLILKRKIANIARYFAPRVPARATLDAPVSE